MTRLSTSLSQPSHKVVISIWVQEEEEKVITEDNENQRQATLKILKRGDENQLESNVSVSVYRIPVSVYHIPVSVYHVPVSREGGR